MDKCNFSKMVFITGSLYYLLAEFICALFFNDSLVNTYLYHTISELGIPNVNSPLSILMNSAFIFIGLALILGSIYELKNYIIKNNRLFYLLTLVTAIGVIIVGLIHGGNPLTSGYHTTGAVMAILGGNILLVVISQSTSESGGYEKATLMLAAIGLIAFWVMFFNINNIYMPVFERLSVYTLIIWCFLTGLHLK